MPCGLSDDELFILYVLYKGRNFKSSSGYHCKKLEKIYIKKKFPLKFDKTINNLLNKGCIAQIRKNDIKYYISDLKAINFALGSHGYSVTQGKIRPL
jgi:hypothetical protein